MISTSMKNAPKIHGKEDNNDLDEIAAGFLKFAK